MISVFSKLASLPLRQVVLTACILAVSVGCQKDEKFVQSLKSEAFAQGYNPHYLDVLWVLDDRSPMLNHRDGLIEEAKVLFQRLDGALGEYGQYRMGIISTDTQYHKGLLQPLASPVADKILVRGKGTLTERTAFFGNIFFPLLNLSRDAYNRGFEASLHALNTTFVSDPRVPLVIVYLSYADDNSEAPVGVDVIDHYENELLKLKNGKADLLRVYAANYMPVAGVPTAAQRCALQNGNAIDTSPATYEDRYFRLAQRFGGDTADLCSAGFAQNLDLTGLQLTVLPKRFALQGIPLVSTLQVRILKGGSEITGFTWTYDAQTRELVFDDTPPQGSTISVTYLPQGS